MKNLKIALWLILIIIIQAIFSRYAGILNFIVPFAISVTHFEDNFNRAAIVGIICGVIWGSLFAESFALAVLLTVLAVLAELNIRERVQYVNNLIKLPVLSGVTVFINSLILYFTKSYTLSGSEAILPQLAAEAVGTALVTVLVYLLVEKTVHKSQKAKRFVL